MLDGLAEAVGTSRSGLVSRLLQLELADDDDRQLICSPAGRRVDGARDMGSFHAEGRAGAQEETNTGRRERAWLRDREEGRKAAAKGAAPAEEHQDAAEAAAARQQDAVDPPPCPQRWVGC